IQEFLQRCFLPEILILRRESVLPGIHLAMGKPAFEQRTEFSMTTRLWFSSSRCSSHPTFNLSSCNSRQLHLRIHSMETVRSIHRFTFHYRFLQVLPSVCWPLTLSSHTSNIGMAHYNDSSLRQLRSRSLMSETKERTCRGTWILTRQSGVLELPWQARIFEAVVLTTLSVEFFK